MECRKTLPEVNIVKKSALTTEYSLQNPGLSLLVRSNISEPVTNLGDNVNEVSIDVMFRLSLLSSTAIVVLTTIVGDYNLGIFHCRGIAFHYLQYIYWNNFCMWFFAKVLSLSL